MSRERITRIRLKNVFPQGDELLANEDGETWWPEMGLRSIEDRDRMVLLLKTQGIRTAIGGYPYVSRNGKIRFERGKYGIWLVGDEIGNIAGGSMA